MKLYRIGRVEQPWVNFEPPIRGGIFRKSKENDTDQEGDIMADDSETDEKSESLGTVDSAFASSLLQIPRASSPTTSVSSLWSDEIKDIVEPYAIPDLAEKKQPWRTCMRRTPLRTVDGHSHGLDPDPANVTPTIWPISQEMLSREAYTAAVEHQEVLDDIRIYPSLDVETQLDIVREYQALHETIKREGHYQCRYAEYGKETIRYSILFAMFLYLLSIGWYLTSAGVLGLFWQQIMFTAHDAGHRGITGRFIPDTIIGAFIADFCCGLSIGWWKSSHNVHHLITNMPEHDPDIQNVPLFATSPSFFKSIWSSFYRWNFQWDEAADWIVPYQKYTYYPVMAIARFNLYLLSWLHLCSPRSMDLGCAWWTRYLELIFLIGYWVIFGYGLLWCTLPTWPIRIGFVLISHCITMILHVQITLSHWGTSTANLGPTESFAQRQLRTTMDVACPAWLDFVHGGLQFQAVHHLFPRVPRHNLRAVQQLVRDFCNRTNLPYQCHGFIQGNEIVLSRLEEIGRMVEILTQCQQHMQETGDSGLH